MIKVGQIYSDHKIMYASKDIIVVHYQGRDKFWTPEEVNGRIKSGQWVLEPTMPANYHKLKIGEIIQEGDMVWAWNKGRWTEYLEGDERIGRKVDDTFHPVIRPEAIHAVVKDKAVCTGEPVASYTSDWGRVTCKECLIKSHSMVGVTAQQRRESGVCDICDLQADCDRLWGPRGQKCPAYPKRFKRNHYGVRYGKFGAYFYDTESGDLTLDNVLELLNGRGS